MNTPDAVVPHPERWNEPGEVQCVVFDLGGVLVPETGNAVTLAVATCMGVPPRRLAAATERYRHDLTVGAATLLDVYGAIVRDLPSPASPQAALEAHLRVHRDAVASIDRDVAQLVASLRRTCRVAALTNTEVEVAAESRRLGLFDGFDNVYTSVDLGLQKPDENIFVEILVDLQCEPARAVFVDDRKENVAAARHAGMRGLRFTSVNGLKRRLAQLVPRLSGPV